MPRQVEQLEPRYLMTGPQLIGISPNEGALLQDGDVRNIAPSELTFRFDENQVIDPNSLAGIRLLQEGTGLAVAPGYVGIGESPNEVIMRFAETLPDDLYRIDIFGSGTNTLKNKNGEVFNGGATVSLEFELNLAPQIVSVVPQPITRAANGSLTQARNQIVVYFNNDDLSVSSAQNPSFYQLIFTNDTVENTDDVVHRPTSVVYDPGSDRAVLTFASDLAQLSSGEGVYRLRIGTGESIPAPPIAVDVADDPGATFSTAFNVGLVNRQDQIISQAIDTKPYPLTFPGSSQQPGESSGNLVADTTDGVTVIPYNFQDVLARDNRGNPIFNVITETQKVRAREALDLISSKGGVQFIETPDQGLIIGTSTIPVAAPGVVAVNGVLQDDTFGGAWFQAALQLLVQETTGLNPAFGVVGEPTFPSYEERTAISYVYRPDSIDVDVYRFQISTSGIFTAETIAERNRSLLDSSIRLYREQGATPALIAQNDDYFGNDSLVELSLEPGTYYVTVASTGMNYDPRIENGTGGTTQGEYDLRLNFRPLANSSLVDATGVALDGDANGRPGGVFNYWFQVAAPANTIFVDKVATGGTGTRGTLANPYTSIATAFNASTPGKVVRIVGNGGADGDVNTLADNRAYEIGQNRFGSLSDGTTMNLPAGITVMIDAGAVFKMFQSSIQVGSASVSIDRSGSAIQVLGTPDVSVTFTSYDDESIGVDTNALPTSPDPGDWGGILIRNDLDRQERRFDWEQEGIFLNYVNHADMRFGGGRVTIASVEQVTAPIHMIDARPTVSYNDIRFSADAALSVNPDAFEQTRFYAVDSLGVNYQEVPFTADYERRGPDVHGNLIVDNTINGMFVRIQTPAGNSLEKLTVSARWDDLDVVHVIPENLILTGQPGGPSVDSLGIVHPRIGASLNIDPGLVVKLDGSRIESTFGAQILAEGTEAQRIIFTSLLDDRFGAGGTFETNNDAALGNSLPAAGDWSGLYLGPASHLSMDNVVVAYGGGLSRVEGSFAAFNAIEIHGATARITNSIFENSDSGRGGLADLNRVDRLDNGKGAIFIQASQPILYNNIIRGTSGIDSPAISIDVNSLNYYLIVDSGRSTGLIDRITELPGNQGPFIRGNRLADNNINGMEVRGGRLVTEGVWDDTDIVHVVLDTISVSNFQTFGGLRLESSTSESLVVKLGTQAGLPGATAGLNTNGVATQAGIPVGGILQVIGQPGHPVVMTSLYDDTVGAGFDTSGQPQVNLTASDRPLPTRDPHSFQIDLNYGPLMRDLPNYRAAAELAARIWESMLEDPVRITIDVEFAPLPPSVLGATSSVPVFLDYDAVRNRMARDAAGRSNEVIAGQLPNLTNFRESVILPDDPANPFTIADTMNVTRANAKALGFSVDQLPVVPSDYDPTEARDARIEMNDDYALWDNSREDLIMPTLYDFAGVMIHEIGHALGFVSSVDAIDTALGDLNALRDIAVQPLDLYLMSPGMGAAGFADAPRNLDPRQDHVVYDGGFFDPVTPRGFPRFTIPGLTVGDVPMSTGEAFGDGAQASHFKSSGFLAGWQLGMMDPAASPGVVTFITQTDRQMFDLIGWDVVGGPVPGDWKGIDLQQGTYDRNVTLVVEREAADITAPGTNAVPNDAQFLGGLAPDQKSGDENLRLGFQIDGLLNESNDVDVYSFDAVAGTEVWLDIDRTTPTLDTVIELIDANGIVLARSDNSYAESLGEEAIFALPPVRAQAMQRTSFFAQDLWSTNLGDAGMRVVLPGAAGQTNTYHVRVRSSSDSINVVSAGVTSGFYELQIRLQDVDERAGTTVQFADIRYAVDGIRVTGLPGSSPLAGVAAEDDSPNDELPLSVFREWVGMSVNQIRSAIMTDNLTFSYDDLIRDPLRDPFGFGLPGITPVGPRVLAPTELQNYGPQLVGDLNEHSGSLSIAGALDFGDTVDWYQIEVSQFGPVSFDIDYADGIGGPDLSLFIYEPVLGASGDMITADLVYSSRSARDTDDLPKPFAGADINDLTRGSVSSGDPFLGPVDLAPGSYLVAVVAAGLEPAELFGQFNQKVAGGDPLPSDIDDRRGFDATLIPNNPYVRVEPISTLDRLVEERFNGPSSFVAPVPLHLGDIPVFLSVSDGQTSTGLYLANPFTGATADDPLIGTFDRPIGDFDLRDQTGETSERDYNFYAYTLGPTDAQAGNYLVINPEDATIRGVDPQDPNTLTDDGIETAMLVDPPTDPPSTTTADVGVQFEAIALLNETIGYAIGYRRDGIENILYQFDVQTGLALGPVRDDAALADPTGAMTNITEIGILDTTMDANPMDNTVLTILSDAVGATGTLNVNDGRRFQVTGNSSLTFEINIGPEIDFDLATDQGRTVLDGDTFSVDGQEFELDTGYVLVVADPTLIADGDTFRITDDNVLSPTTVTFEFSTDANVTAGNVAVPLTAGATADEIANSIVAAINDSLALDTTAVAVGNRVSLRGDVASATGVATSSGGLALSGAPGTTAPGARAIQVEEFFGVRDVANAFQASFNHNVYVVGNSVIFVGFNQVDIANLVARGIAQTSTASGAVAAGNIAVNITPADSSEVIALKLAAAMSGNGIPATVVGSAVALPDTNTTFSASSTIARVSSVGGAAPGGRLLGMAFLGNQLYAVSNRGGLFLIDYNGGTADYVETSAQLGRITFSGLTEGPPNAEGGAYRNTLFASTSTGRLYAFDTAGVPQGVFVNGAKSVNTGIAGVNGLVFSPVDQNLWQNSNRRGPDAGHGVLPGAGGSSLHFGDANPDLTINRNYNFPGGAHGSLMTDEFSLEGYTANDEPMMYFNYFLVTDQDSPGEANLDSLRVYVSDEGSGGQWVLVAANGAGGAGVQNLWDNSWEDVPELYPGDNVPATNDPGYLLRRDGVRDPYTDNRSQNPANAGGGGGGGGGGGQVRPLPTPSEEVSIWRQARIPLAQFAGNQHIRIRFDFSSAGGISLGDPLNGGTELHALDGASLADGDQFVIDDVVFEFDSGYTVDLAAGNAIADNDTLLLQNAAGDALGFTFQREAQATKRVVLPPTQAVADGQTLTLLLTDDSSVTFEFDNDQQVTDGNVLVEITGANPLQALSSAINNSSLGFTAAVAGNSLLLSDPSVSVDVGTTPLIDVQSVIITDTDVPLTVAAALADAINNAGLPDVTADLHGHHVNLVGVAHVQQTDGSANVVRGAAGVSAGAVPVDIHAGMSAVDVAEQISLALADTFADGQRLAIKTFDSIVRVHGHVVTDPGPLGMADQLANDSNALFAPARLADNQFQYVVVDQQQGGGGGGGGGQGGPQFDETGLNYVIPYEGAYLDDFVIGFASRGEAIINHRDNFLAEALTTGSEAFPTPPEDRPANGTTQTQRVPIDASINPLNGVPGQAPGAGNQGGGGGQQAAADGLFDGDEQPRFVNRSHFLPERPTFVGRPTGNSTGRYQLEIRSELGAVAGLISAGTTFDPQDRFSTAVTLFAPAGNEIFDGQTFQLNNGDRTVTFEYEDADRSNGVTAGHLPVLFHASDADEVVAEAIRATINAPATRSLLKLTAESPDGVVIGPSNSPRINLNGNVLITDDDGIAFELFEGTSSVNRTSVQGQIVIDSNEIWNSQMYGVTIEDGFRAMPEPLTFDPTGLLGVLLGDYNSPLGTGRNFASANTANQLTGVVVSNNILARGRAGGVQYAGDPGGYIIIPPIGGTDGQGANADYPPTEVWDQGGVYGPFIFSITDRNGLTVQFEFDTDGVPQNVLNTVLITYQTNANCPYNDRDCIPRSFAGADNDMAEAMISAIMGTGLDVNVIRNADNRLFIEGATSVVGVGVAEGLDTVLLVDWFSPWYARVEPVRPFGRIVNNTIVGVGGPLTDEITTRVDILNPQPGQETTKRILIDDFRDVGISITDGAYPTVLNNIVVNTQSGIASDVLSRDAVLGGTLFKQNVQNAKGINPGDFTLTLSPSDPLFVNVATNNFYLAANARAIDSSVDSLEDRPQWASYKTPLGIGLSPVLAPDRDVLGQLREDDPSVETPNGLGNNVFKDRGAIDRVDFLGPNVVLLSPRDNDAEGVDKNPLPTVIELEGGVLSNFTIQFVDTFRVGDPREGTGVDPSTVTPDRVIVTEDGTQLVAGVDYTFSFDALNSVIRLTPVAGVWPGGRSYTIALSNLIRDVAGNALQPNQTTGETIFRIGTVIGSDYGDAPRPYPTLLANGGPRHTILPDYYLGTGVTADTDGQPNSNAASDGLDDGVALPSLVERDSTVSFSVTASAAGFLDGWIDFNQDGDWNDANERVFESRPLIAGANTVSITIPATAVDGKTFARFRFSSLGGLAPTGPASDGEVEDYTLEISAGDIWQNPTEALDVNNDGHITAIDALLVINEINNRHVSDPTTGSLPIPPVPPQVPTNSPPGYVDVDGNRFVSARDALLIINHINSRPAGEPEDAPLSAAVMAPGDLDATITDVAVALAGAGKANKNAPADDDSAQTDEWDRALAEWLA